MIKIVYLDGKVEYQDVRRLTSDDLFLIFGSYATMRYLYSTRDAAGRPVDFYVVFQGGLEREDGTYRLPINEAIYDEFGVKAYGTAIICKADVLDWDEE